MIVPYHLSVRKTPMEADPHAWEYTRKVLYPHHSQFWPEKIPEHVYYEQQALRLRQQKQREWLLSFFRFRWLTAYKPFGKKPYRLDPICESPVKCRYQQAQRGCHRRQEDMIDGPQQ